MTSVIFFFISLAFSVAVLAMEKPADHFHVQACVKCHSDGIDIKAILRNNDNSCLNCHTRTEIKHKLKTIASAPQNPVEQKDEGKAVLGMQFPMFSAESRLGDKPNEMASVPAGTFIRGTNERLFDEGPQHTAKTRSFLIDKYEVTNLQYKRFIEETRRKSPKHFVNRNYPEGKADHPVTYVDWYDAKEYCEWAGKRLPSDVEWEKAARGHDGRTYPWGNTFEVKNANMPLRWLELGRKLGDTTPVGAFEGGRSPFGVYDMTGNVWEWTDSWYQAYPNSKVASENYGKRYKTLKGGSWFDCSFYKCGISAPVYNRAFFARRTKNDTFGFRCAKDSD
ncbi:MAG: formylglycine-generating enzyme family protein [Gammaproteobacteria bacterium]|nr:formylglycine-generating enzyme family protein [Gammaproteobacteria bacterium]